MPCDVKWTPGGGYAIACSRGQRQPRCSSCGARASKLCDYRVERDGKPATCDRALCTRCAVRVPFGSRFLDYCPPHYRSDQKRSEPAQLDHRIGDAKR